MKRARSVRTILSLAGFTLSLIFLSSCRDNSTLDSGFRPGLSSNFFGSGPDVSLSSVIAAGTDDSANAFAGGSLNGVAWDSTNHVMKLDPTTSAQTYRELDSSWTPHYSEIVGYWKLNGTLGGIADGVTIPGTVGPDGISSNTNGTGMSYESGQLNQGVYFDGGDDYISIPNTPSLNPTSEISVSAWIKTPTPTKTYQMIVTKSGDSQWSLRFDSNSAKIAFVLSSNYFGKYHSKPATLISLKPSQSA